MKNNISASYKERFFKISVLIILPILLTLGLSLGAFFISPLRSLFLLFSSSVRLENQLETSILFDIHAVRTCVAFFTGMLLALSGTAFQGLFRNPLADPYCLGVSSGASFGAVLAISIVQGVFLKSNIQDSSSFYESGLNTFWSSPLVTNLGAFVGSLASVLIVFMIARFVRYSSVTLLLSGTAISAMFSSLVSLLFITSKNNFTTALLWTLGSFSTASFSNLIILMFGICIIFPVLYKKSHTLDILSGGEKDAQSLGVNIKSTYLSVGLLGAFAAGLAVSAGGVIGFIGLISPHLARQFLGAKHSKLFIWSTLLGGEITLLSDILSRTIILPAELPIGIITSFFGVPFFIFLVINKGRVKENF